MLKYVVGDATLPKGDGTKIIAHICNDQGGWGAGFVVAVSSRWPEPEAAYREWYRDEDEFGVFALGEVQLVNVIDDVYVANMIGQTGYGRDLSVPPIRYEAVATALSTLADIAIDMEASVHMPRIGAGLAGGKWERIEPIIEKSLSDRGISVTVYDLP